MVIARIWEAGTALDSGSLGIFLWPAEPTARMRDVEHVEQDDAGDLRFDAKDPDSLFLKKAVKSSMPWATIFHPPARILYNQYRKYTPIIVQPERLQAQSHLS